MSIFKSRVAAVSVGALLLAGAATTGAVADGLIGSRDVKNGSLRSVDVKNGNLGMRDLNTYTKNQINQPGPAGADGEDGTDGKDGAQGPKGDTGAQGPAGPKGDPGDPATVGISHWSVGAVVPAAANGMPGSIEVVAECQQEGHLAIGGGYTAGGYKGGVTTYQNRNTAGAPGTDAYGAGWLVGFTNTTDQPQNVRTWVVCASVTQDEPTS